tara:strand:+ start:1005 stop:1211 length:207 start_codon:yes stop_codon:yes gene_type:complete
MYDMTTTKGRRAFATDYLTSNTPAELKAAAEDGSIGDWETLARTADLCDPGAWEDWSSAMRSLGLMLS